MKGVSSILLLASFDDSDTTIPSHMVQILVVRRRAGSAIAAAVRDSDDAADVPGGARVE
jgi:hypothetical protein